MPTNEIAQDTSAPAEARDAVQHDGERLSDLAYRKILEGLFDRSIPAGGFVSQNTLVQTLGIPVQPLRDALRVLEAEGVLEVHPRSGIQFLKPDLELARSTYQFRTIIERSAARSYAESGDPAEFAELIAIHEKLLERVRTEPFGPELLEDLDEAEARLHGAMLASLRNPLVENTARRLKNYVRLIKLERLITAPLALRTLREHMEILRALERRDADAAEAALAAHFQAALQRILGIF